MCISVSDKKKKGFGFKLRSTHPSSAVETCEKTGTVQDCDNATVYCAKYVENIYLRSGRDIYDIRASQDQKSGTEFPKFLNTPHVLKQIGARTKFRHCSTNVVSQAYMHIIRNPFLCLFDPAPRLLQDRRLVSLLTLPHPFLTVDPSFFIGHSARNFAPAVGNLLDNGIRVLLFVGDADYRANWVRKDR